MAGGLLVGANIGGNGFVAAGAGAIAGPTTTNDTWAPGNNTLVTTNDTIGMSSTTNSLEFNTAGNLTVTLSGANTIQSGGILVGSTATSGTIAGGSITTGSAGGDMWIYLNGKPLTINSVIADNSTSSMSVGGSSTLTLGGINTYAGQTNIASGATLAIASTGGLASSGTVNIAAGATLSVASGGTITGAITDNGAFNVAAGETIGGVVSSPSSLGSITETGGPAGIATVPLGGGTFATVTVVTSGTLHLNTQPGTSTTITNGLAGTGVIDFGGTGSTTLATKLGTAGQLFVLTSGAVTVNNARQMSDNVEVDGGFLTVLGDRFGYNQTGETYLQTGGVVYIPSSDTYGVRMGCDSGVGSGQVAVTGTQSGGLYLINNGFSIGGTSASASSSFLLSGGVMDIYTGGLNLGADTGGSSTTAFTLSGSGTLLVATSTINGNQGSGAKQNFIFNGGTLAALGIDMTKLTTTGATTGVATSPGATLNNNGGVLAPGNLGIAGKTAITGNYIQSGNAALSVALGGVTVANAFQNLGVGTYSGYVTVSGNATLGGSIEIGVVPGFEPTSANTFTVLNDTGVLSGTGGAFQSFRQTVNTNEGFSTMTVTTTAGTGGTVVLGGYTITNQWAGTGSNWSNAAGAASWTNSDPNSNTVGAYFANTGGTVNLLNNRTVRNVTFNNSSAPFTLAGSGTLTLDGGSVGLAVINDVAGSATINVPMSLNTALEAGGASGTTLTLSGNVAEGANALTFNGGGTVLLTGTNTGSGAFNVMAGTVEATKAAALPQYADPSLITVFSGATLAVQVDNTGVNGQFTAANLGSLLADSAVATFNSGSILGIDTTNSSGGTFTYGSNISGALGLTKLGPGTLVMSGAESYTGATLVSAGTLNLTGTTTGSAITVNGATAYYNESAGGVIGSTTAFTLTSGSATLSGANTYTGATMVGNGTLNLTGTMTGSSITVNGAAANFNESAGGSIGSAATAFTLTAGNATLSGVNAFTGLTTITSGTLAISGNSSAASGGDSVTGTLLVNNNQALGTGAVTMNAGGTIDSTVPGITNSSVTPFTWGTSWNFGGTNSLNLGTGAVTAPNASTTISLNGSGSTLTFGGAMTNTAGAIQTLTVNGPGNTLCTSAAITSATAAPATWTSLPAAAT